MKYLSSCERSRISRDMETQRDDSCSVSKTEIIRHHFLIKNDNNLKYVQKRPLTDYYSCGKGDGGRMGFLYGENTAGSFIFHWRAPEPWLGWDALGRQREMRCRPEALPFQNTQNIIAYNGKMILNHRKKSATYIPSINRLNTFFH